MFPKSLNFEPISTTQQYCVSGDVAIYPGVAIAPGVLLQADEGSRIVIRAGVCIGLGCVIHAHQGTITINEGANLGAGVLLIGDVTIGARACLGSAVTVLNSVVDPGKILESGMVIGDKSRRVELDDLLDSIPMNDATPHASSNGSSNASSNASSNGFKPHHFTNTEFASNGFASAPPSKPNAEPAVRQTVQPQVQHIDDFEPIVTPAPVTPTPVISTYSEPAVTTPAYPNAPPTDTAGKPWQPCDTDPWDPSDRPPGETTCQVTSKPKDATPFNGTIYSDQNYSSPYPPYQNPPSSSTAPSPVSTYPVPEPTPVTAPSIATEPSIDSDLSRDEMGSPIETTSNPEVKPKENSIVPKDTTPKPVYGQAYVNQMLGKMLGR
jgi:carbonic anhydrase/acetyltransferase-like protein (isoleucine patch superfamily)